jgi:small conductance mechanosensitive channel
MDKNGPVILDSRTEKMISNALDVFVDYSLDILGAIVLLVVGWSIASWVQRLVMRALSRLPKMDETLKPFIGKLVWWVVIVFVLVAVLNQFGVHTTSIIAVLGAAGLAIGLALQGTLANVAAGVMLLILRPFSVGDYIDAGGDAGTVVEVGLFNTELRTFDGLCRMVPNSKIWTNTITNYNRNPSRRVDVPIGISYSDDIVGAQKVLMDLMKGDQRILGDPAPEVMVTELADSAVVLNMRCWTKGGDYWATLFDLNKAAKIGIEAAGYSIPFPQRDVHMVGDGSQPAGKE